MKTRISAILNYKKPAFWIVIFAILSVIIAGLLFLTNPEQGTYRITFHVPAGTQDQLIYSDEEISPFRQKVYFSVGRDVGDSEIVLEDLESGDILSTYVTPGFDFHLPVKRGAWYRVGIHASNDTEEDQTLLVEIKKIQVRIADRVYKEEEQGASPLEAGPETQQEEIDENNDLKVDTGYLEELVSGIGLKHAFPWNNTVDFKENANVLIKMATDETGAYEIYGIMSEKYGDFGLLLNHIINGEDHWNFVYERWLYTGANSEKPILERGLNNEYIFSYVYDKEDGVPLYQECILDCGYENGYMHLTPVVEKEETPQGYDGERNPVLISQSEIATIIVTNGWTGEQKTYSVLDSSNGFRDILNAYYNLDVTPDESIEMRIGYQYMMDLYDVNGTLLQRITPYKDCVNIDGTMYDSNQNNSASMLLQVLSQ